MAKWECYRGCTWEGTQDYKECPNCGAKDVYMEESESKFTYSENDFTVTPPKKGE